jgi:hypothetical protein
MSHKTLGRVISWSFAGVSALCLLGAVAVLLLQPSAANMVLVSSASLGLSTTTWLASQD